MHANPRDTCSLVRASNESNGATFDRRTTLPLSRDYTLRKYGHCKLRFDGQTNRPFGREATGFDRLKIVVYDK